MLDGVLVVVLAAYGLMLGSFAGAQVWRLRARQLREDKAAGELYDKAELRKLQPLATNRLREDHSQCLHCGHQLRWYDLIPLVSWVSTNGRCRYCRRPIGWFEPVIELATAGLFVISYLWWPVELSSTVAIVQFCVWLLVVVVMVVLFAYDMRWYLLPNPYTIALAVLALAYYSCTSILQGGVSSSSIMSLAGAFVILCGIYLFLWWYSGGRWIGFGDIKLGVGLSLLVGQWQLAFLTLFVANLLGAVVAVALMATSRINRKAHIPFGPFLIIAAILSVLAGQYIIDRYLDLTTRLFM